MCPLKKIFSSIYHHDLQHYSYLVSKYKALLETPSLSRLPFHHQYNPCFHPSIQGPSHHSYLEEHVGREGMQISGALRIRRTLPSFPSSSTSYEVISHYYHGLCRLSQFALRPSFSLHPRFLSCLWRNIVRWQHLYDSNHFPC